ncbi:MAG: hypothetical protein ACI83O_000511 [Patescibacteria group bacterium]|jgi:hypothetical protein
METIQVDKDIKAKLDMLKEHDSETYNELLSRVVAVLNPRGQESLLETIEILSDSETMQNIEQGLQEIREGKVSELIIE